MVVELVGSSSNSRSASSMMTVGMSMVVVVAVMVMLLLLLVFVVRHRAAVAVERICVMFCSCCFSGCFVVVAVVQSGFCTVRLVSVV